ncbi:MAG TPA: efflux RND transporter periplasmic adaptor subunit [Kofleriaceae bacterium]|nr:efflux RND transporter periplasmic adaptor subunit [Kofleriaceae bacterium]
MTDWVKPLPQHHGAHGGLMALGLLVASGIVVWATHPRQSIPPVSEAPPAAHAPPVPTPLPAGRLAETPSEPVIVAPLPTRVTATGFVSFDERRTTHIGVPVAGLFEKKRATSVGRWIRQGETLGTIYSPEVYLTTVDLLGELRTFTSQENVDRERIRLLRWGMPRPTLAAIEKKMTPQLALPLVTRTAGIVVAEQGESRRMIDPSSRFELFTITEPAYTWVFVQVPDADAARTQPGTPAKLTVEGITRPIAAKVAYVFRRSEEGKRTVRFDVYSPRVMLPPNARVSAELQLSATPAPAKQ